MGKIPPAGKVILTTVITGLFVWVATYVIAASVPASDVRNAFLLLMWPLGLVSATAVIWRWLGSPTENARREAIGRVIEAGAVLAAKMRSVGDAEKPRDDMGTEREAWKLRLGDWTDDAVRMLHDVAPESATAFTADLIYTDSSHVDAPAWISDLVLDLELRVQTLRNIRSSL